jgi:hypothetical protein
VWSKAGIGMPILWLEQPTKFEVLPQVRVKALDDKHS